MLIETDNQETDTQPPAALPSPCPLPAASRFQQMPEIIRTAYVSTRSNSAIAILEHILPEEFMLLLLHIIKFKYGGFSKTGSLVKLKSEYKIEKGHLKKKS